MGLTASIANPAYADHTPAPGASSSTAATSDNLSKEQKALQQTLSPEQPVGTGRTEISSGHVDMGPRFTDGKFQLMIHDDHAATPIWRSVDDVLYRAPMRHVARFLMMTVIRLWVHSPANRCM